MSSTGRVIRLPASVLAELGRSLDSEVGEGVAVRALQRAGFVAGEAFIEEFANASDAPLGESSMERFWGRMSAFFEEHGFGTLEFDASHEGVGLVHAAASVESLGRIAVDGAPPGCAFTTGLLSQMLTRVSGAPVAVLEIACRGAGDGRCSFAFGSEETIGTLHERLRAGQSGSEALSSLA